jgi:hypothetical protein
MMNDLPHMPPPPTGVDDRRTMDRDDRCIFGTLYKIKIGLNYRALLIHDPFSTSQSGRGSSVLDVGVG